MVLFKYKLEKKMLAIRKNTVVLVSPPLTSLDKLHYFGLILFYTFNPSLKIIFVFSVPSVSYFIRLKKNWIF